MHNAVHQNTHTHTHTHRMEMQSEVELYGMWASSYCTRVELALKLKGIPYKYIEEDLTNKSELLLHYNPVHKKVPVLVHNGKPISESLVILEYIEEHWNNTPKLLPEDPYERAKVRFWTHFYDQKVIPSSLPIIMCKGEDQEKAVEEYSELLGVFEEGIEKDFPGKRSPFFNGDTLGFLDIVVGSISCNYRAFLEALPLGKSIGPENQPGFYSWVDALIDCPLMKETHPPHDKLVAMIRNKFGPSPKV